MGLHGQWGILGKVSMGTLSECANIFVNWRVKRLFKAFSLAQVQYRHAQARDTRVGVRARAQS